jgi:hypothetical protein
MSEKHKRTVSRTNLFSGASWRVKFFTPTLPAPPNLKTSVRAVNAIPPRCPEAQNPWADIILWFEGSR